MKYAVISLIFVFIVIGAYYAGFNSGKNYCTNEYNQKIIEHSQESEKRLQELKNNIKELNSENRKIKNETCDKIRSFALRDNCRK